MIESHSGEICPYKDEALVFQENICHLENLVLHLIV